MLTSGLNDDVGLVGSIVIISNVTPEKIWNKIVDLTLSKIWDCEHILYSHLLTKHIY